MKDLSAVAKNEQNDFFNSVDYILCDVDGVLWRLGQAIPGAKEAIAALKDLKKKIIFVSNNCTRSHDDYYQELTSAGYDLEKSDLILPVLVMIDFLKKQNFSKDIFLIGMSALRGQLQGAGFSIEDFDSDNLDESVPKYVKHCISLNKNVGAVIADIDVNMRVAQLERAAQYLKNPEVSFITGGSDKQLDIGPAGTIIGPGCFHAILEDMTGRKPNCLAKPSTQLNDFIKEKFSINDPSRVLFIGDSISEDMGFATNCSYRKLLVLSGLTQKMALENWGFPENYKPDYFVDSLKNVHNILK